MANTYDTNLGVSIYGGASDMAARRGPQGIPLGTPGTYQLPGGRVASEEYRPIAEAQASWDPSSGVSFAQHMKDAGFENPFKEGAMIGGGPATGWSWETMSTPYMDWASGRNLTPAEQQERTTPKHYDPNTNSLVPGAIYASSVFGKPSALTPDIESKVKADLSGANDPAYQKYLRDYQTQGIAGVEADIAANWRQQPDGTWRNIVDGSFSLTRPEWAGGTGINYAGFLIKGLGA